jgi:hypothetical protein
MKSWNIVNFVPGARSPVYHWGEDGLAGFSDDKQQLCFAHLFRRQSEDAFAYTALT